MFLPDVNVLIYAHRSDSCADHAAYAEWLTGLATGYEPFALSSLALAGVVRIVTNPRIFRSPSTHDEVFDSLASLSPAPTLASSTPDRATWRSSRTSAVDQAPPASWWPMRTTPRWRWSTVAPSSRPTPTSIDSPVCAGSTRSGGMGDEIAVCEHANTGRVRVRSKHDNNPSERAYFEMFYRGTRRHATRNDTLPASC